MFLSLNIWFQDNIYICIKEVFGNTDLSLRSKKKFTIYFWLNFWWDPFVKISITTDRPYTPPQLFTLVVIFPSIFFRTVSRHIKVFYPDWFFVFSFYLLHFERQNPPLPCPFRPLTTVEETIVSHIFLTLCNCTIGNWCIKYI